MWRRTELRSLRRHAALAALLAVGGAALAVPGAQAAPGQSGDVQMGISKKLDKKVARLAGQNGASRSFAPNVDVPSPPVGTVKDMPQINEVTGALEWLPFTLRAVGAHVEVWVANDLLFPTGDCRNDGVRETVTDAPGRVPGRPVRHEHVPEGVGDLQPARSAGPASSRGTGTTCRGPATRS